MNEEYILLGGWFWWLLRKPVMMWRNHHAGTVRTDIAMFFCTKIFCTSRFSYTARSRKTIIMPVGVDTQRFSFDANNGRIPHSILFLSGMWETKRPEMLIDALEILHKKGVEFVAHFYGSPLPNGGAYYQSLQERSVQAGLSEIIEFHAGVPNKAVRDLFQSHEIFVNCSLSGMFDKAIFEAAACGCRVLAVSDDFALLTQDPDTHFTTIEELADRLIKTLEKPPLQAIPAYVEANSLTILADRLQKIIN
jgi:glycosyltransferase involved in cell wall biosynthesis